MNTATKLCGILMVSVALTAAGTASADSADDNYLALLASHGVAGPPDQLIADGHQVCDALGQGAFGIGISPQQFALVKLNMDLITAQGFSQHDASQLMLDATRAYCPEHTPPQ